MRLPNMTHPYRDGFEASARSGTAPARQAWIAPNVIRLEAGAAELGANPVRPENLGMGS